MNRRERTHRLIELGGLVVKSGLDQLLRDDRAAIYGGLLELAALIHRSYVYLAWRVIFSDARARSRCACCIAI